MQFIRVWVRAPRTQPARGAPRCLVARTGEQSGPERGAQRVRQRPTARRWSPQSAVSKAFLLRSRQWRAAVAAGLGMRPTGRGAQQTN